MDRKRDKKNNYKSKFANSKRGDEIKRSITGFLVTCESSKEKRCVREIFNVLNDFVDKVYPDLELQTLLAPTVAKVQSIDDDLDAELNQIQKSKRIWYTFDMQSPGVIFIKLLDQMREHIDVAKIMEAILTHIHTTGEILTKFACRMLPIISLQKANL